MSAQGSGVRLTATTVPDDQSRPSDGPAALNEQFGIRFAVDCQWAPMELFLRCRRSTVRSSCHHTAGPHLLTYPETRLCDASSIAAQLCAIESA
jgi:hypothetical protein